MNFEEEKSNLEETNRIKQAILDLFSVQGEIETNLNVIDLFRRIVLLEKNLIANYNYLLDRITKVEDKDNKFKDSWENKYKEFESFHNNFQDIFESPWELSCDIDFIKEDIEKLKGK